MTNAIKIPQNTYAIILEDPMLPAIIAGSTKIPEPIIMFTMLADKPMVPILLFNPSSI
jgi:hypothetical protein